MNIRTSLALIIALSLVVLGLMMTMSSPEGTVGTEPKATTTPAASSTITLEVRIDERGAAHGVEVIPRELVEDSRCPADVQCIQAGTVRVMTDLTSGMGSAPQMFTLGQAITTESEEILLVRVLPEVKKAGTVIADTEYQFVFEVKKRTDLSGY